MSILAQNIKTIRKELKCTQSAMADILKVGFRTYVRYEAGERDAPVSVLVKMARLGNISLEQLLTQKIEHNDISPIPVDSLNVPPPVVKSVNFKAGQIAFAKPRKEGLLTLDAQERRILSAFRKIPAARQKEYLKSLVKRFKPSSANPRVLRSTGTRKTTKSAKDLVEAVVVKKAPPRKGRPGRRKLDRKALKAKIDSLKSITKTIPKITVR